MPDLVAKMKKALGRLEITFFAPMEPPPFVLNLDMELIRLQMKSE